MQRRTCAIVAGAAAAGVAVALRPGTHGNKVVRRELARAGRRVRHLGGRVEGATYRLRGRHPDPAVVDNVLADRIRSELGSLEHRLDLPHVHVMVERHVALLHGDVGTDEDARRIEKRVAAVSGVAGVESYLHVGLTHGEARPSSATHPPSAALARLRAAAEGAGVSPHVSDHVLRAVLATFADRLPEGQRTHLQSHLPADVRSLFVPPRRMNHQEKARRAQDLVERITAVTSELPQGRAEAVTAAVLQALRAVVPDEAAKVASVLPSELRELWQGPSAA